MPDNRQRSGHRRDKRKSNATSWKPGQSGNPGGRPKSVKEVQQYASTFTIEMVDILVREARTAAEAKDRIRAADIVLDRACGRPVSLFGEDAGTANINVYTGIAPPPPGEEEPAEEQPTETEGT